MGRVISWLLHPLIWLFKALVRPLASRARRYLVAGLTREVVELRTEIGSMREALLKDHVGVLDVLVPRLELIDQYASATARRVAISGDPGEILVRTAVGYVLCSASDYPALMGLVETGDVEVGTRLLIQRFLAPGDVFIDVGANIGMHTLAAARAMQGRGRILAFEPYPPTACLLERSVRMNGFSSLVEVHRSAASNRQGSETLHLGRTSGHHSLLPLGSGASPSLPPIQVSVSRLDAVVAGEQGVDLIKVDVEGAELDVLEGATAIIEREHDIALIVEFSPLHMRLRGCSTERWLSGFGSHDLVFQAIDDVSGRLHRWSADALQRWSVDALESEKVVNLFFSRPGSSAWARAGD